MSGETHALQRLAGNIIITIGVLWMLLCGACTGFFLFLMAAGGLQTTKVTEILPVLAYVLLPGALGMALGWGIVVAGRAVGKRGKAGA